MRKQMGRAAFSHLFGRGDLGDGAVLRYPAAASDGRVKSADPFVLRVSRRAGGGGAEAATPERSHNSRAGAGEVAGRRT